MIRGLGLHHMKMNSLPRLWHRKTVYLRTSGDTVNLRSGQVSGTVWSRVCGNSHRSVFRFDRDRDEILEEPPEDVTIDINPHAPDFVWESMLFQRVLEAAEEQ